MNTYGIENELTWQAAEGLVVRVPFSFQHCEYGKFTTLNSAGTETVDLSGLPVNRCPDVTATLDVNYTLPFSWNGSRVVVDVNDNYVSKNLDTYSIALPYASFTQTYADARALLGRLVDLQRAGQSLVRPSVRSQSHRQDLQGVGAERRSAVGVGVLWGAALRRRRDRLQVRPEVA